MFRQNIKSIKTLSTLNDVAKNVQGKIRNVSLIRDHV